MSITLQPYGYSQIDATLTSLTVILPDGNLGAQKIIQLKTGSFNDVTVETSTGNYLLTPEIPVRRLVFTENGWIVLSPEYSSAYSAVPLTDYLNQNSSNAIAESEQGSTVALDGAGTLLVSGLANNPYYVGTAQGVLVWAYADNVWELQQEILTTQLKNGFGYSIAVSSDGSTLAIGSPNYNSNQGGVSIYQQQAGIWVQTAFLTQTVTGITQQGFGVSLSETGTVLATVGNGSSTELIVWTYSGGTWTPVDVSGGVNLVSMIVNLSLGATVILTATNSGSGPAVFNYLSGNWYFNTILSASLTGYTQGSYISLSGSGTTALSSAIPSNNTNPSYVLVWTSSILTWTNTAQITIDTGFTIQQVCISSDGGTILVSLSTTPYTVTDLNYIYQNIAGTWTLLSSLNDQGILLTSGYPMFNTAMSSNGDVVALGAFLYNIDQGAVYIGRNIGSTTWQLQDIVSIYSDNLSFYAQGFSTSLSEDGFTLAVGMPGSYIQSTDSNGIGIWTYSNGLWSLQQLIKYGCLEDYYQGYCVRLSRDASILIVLAPYYYGTSPSTIFGCIYVFTLVNGKFQDVPVTLSFAPYRANLTSQGSLIAISPDNLVIAAMSFNPPEGAVGVLLIWYYTGGAWLPTAINIPSVTLVHVNCYVSIDIRGGNTYVLGVSSNVDPSGNQVALVYTSPTSSGTSWTLEATLNSGTAAGGGDIVVTNNGTTLALGSLENPPSGGVFIWTYSSGAWSGSPVVVTATLTSGVLGGSLAMSLDGTILAVGNYRYSTTGETFIFQLIGGLWTQQSGSPTIYSNGVIQGYSVALSGSGTTLITGDPANYEQNTMTNSGEGSAYIWTYDGSWNFQQAVQIENQLNLYYSLGTSVSFSANGLVCAAGVPQYNQDQGGVVVWDLINGQLENQTILTYPFSGTAPLQGSSISLSGDGSTLAVGAPDYDSNTGAVIIWIYTTFWSPQQLLSTGSGSLQQGISVSLSSDGNTLAAGAPGYSPAGAVIIWNRSSGVWTQTTILTGGGSDIGASVSLSANGQVLAIGAPRGSNGQVNIFSLIRGTWTSITTLQNDTYTSQGSSVSLSSSGDTLAVASIPSQGALIWEMTNGSWSFSTFLTDSTRSGSNQGQSISLSGDGNTLAIGGNTYNTTQGATWIWSNTGKGWINTNFLTDSKANEAEQGYSVSLAKNGSPLIVGGPGYSDSSMYGVWIYL